MSELTQDILMYLILAFVWIFGGASLIQRPKYTHALKDWVQANAILAAFMVIAFAAAWAVDRLAT